MVSCYFIGHRECPDGILPTLEETIERHIAQYGVEQFIVGSYGGFDALAAKALLNAKQRHPEIQLLQLTPYHPGERKIELRKGFDGMYYPFEIDNAPRRAAIVKANQQMIKTCDYLIAYAWHSASNARELLEKALMLEVKGGIHVENLAENRLRQYYPDGLLGNR